MKSRWMRRRALLVAACIPLLGGCNILDSGAAKEVHVIVDANVDEPLLLIVSSNFVAGSNTQGQTQSNIAKADTTLVSNPYDHTYTLDPSAPLILVRLENNAANSASVRLQIFLDGNSDYDTSRQLATGEFLEYAYTNLSR